MRRHDLTSQGTAGRSSDVVIVGGGVIGAATLFELARRGVKARLIERGEIGGESTGKSAAIVRMHYSNAPVVRMALRSRRTLQDFAAITGSPPVYFETGWCYVVPEGDLVAVRAVAEMTRSEGVEVIEMAPEDVLPGPSSPMNDLFPALDTNGIARLFFEPQSGFADPRATTSGLINAACSLGAVVEEGVRATGLSVRRGRVIGVETLGGPVAAGTVVVAAGAWSAVLLATAGVTVPLTITREQELYLDVPVALKPRACMSDLVDRIYVRPYLERGDADGAVIVGRGFPKPYEVVDPDAPDSAASLGFEEDVRERLARRLPRLAPAPRLGGISGLYAVTPDWHPYLGAVDGLENLVVATGGSGHCFKLAPAIGEMVAADIVGDRVCYADIDLFNVRRIESNELFTAAIGGNRA
jgi:glycine/D-amino acid oxidase-like deaminating enzyme